MGLWIGKIIMPAERVTMDVIGTKDKCDVCGIGYMAAIDKRFVRNDETMFPHQCTNCGHKADYTVSYPTVEFDGLD